MNSRKITEDLEKAEATSHVDVEIVEETSHVANSNEDQAARNLDPNSMRKRSKEIAKYIPIIGLQLIIWGILMLIGTPVMAVFAIAYLLWKESVKRIFPQWKKIFVISCVFAVVVDPLFLYIPIISEHSKRIEMDKKLNKTAFVLRTVTDFSYVVDIIVQYYGPQTIWHSYIPIDILAILPLPQAVIFFFFSKSEDSTRKLMNFLAMTQYVPRVLRIYSSCKEIKEAHGDQIGIWMKGVLNFFLYILASHVAGAFWYFFAVQRMSTCWKTACQPSVGCYDGKFRNTTFDHDFCTPTSPPNGHFDFGIYADALQPGISGSTDHPQKLAHCFGWGLRNLSSLGSNLQPGISTWENLFAAFISLIGQLLFLYLVGNLQMYMQLHTAREEEARKEKLKEISAEKDRKRKEIEKELKRKVTEIASWLDDNTIISKSEKKVAQSQITGIVKHKLEQGKKGKDVDAENILSVLPSDTQKFIDEGKTWKTLKKVPKLASMDEQVLKAMCKHFEPTKYTKGSYIIRENNPLGMMFFIIDGKVKQTKRNEGQRILLQPGDFYGGELLEWVKFPIFPYLVPHATSSAVAVTNVEARVLKASDLCAYREYFSESDSTHPPDPVKYDLGLGNPAHPSRPIERAASI